MVHIMARIVARPDAAEALKKILLALIEPSRNEPGCVAYTLFQRNDMPHELQTVERWRTQADADAHMLTAHVRSAIAAAAPLLAQPPVT
jgi:quinol monooxygenase YgiN